jgi:hypothetical protein
MTNAKNNPKKPIPKNKQSGIRINQVRTIAKSRFFTLVSEFNTITPQKNHFIKR